MEQTQQIALPTLVLELLDGQIKITPNKANPGAPVIIDAIRLERWAAKLYREEVLP